MDMAPPRASNEKVVDIAERPLTRDYRSSAVLIVVGRDPDLVDTALPLGFIPWAPLQ
jgi:hypothetical protein